MKSTPVTLRTTSVVPRLIELPGPDGIPFVGEVDAVIDEVREFVTGERSDRVGDRVLATVLFSDIVDSTAEATALGDRLWRQRLDAHDAMVRRELQRFRGREVKTTGDGFLARSTGQLAPSIAAMQSATELHTEGSMYVSAWMPGRSTFAGKTSVASPCILRPRSGMRSTW